jgi:hypothetical protein
MLQDAGVAMEVSRRLINFVTPSPKSIWLNLEATPRDRDPELAGGEFITEKDGPPDEQELGFNSPSSARAYIHL